LNLLHSDFSSKSYPCFWTPYHEGI